MARLKPKNMFKMSRNVLYCLFLARDDHELKHVIIYTKKAEKYV